MRHIRAADEHAPVPRDPSVAWARLMSAGRRAGTLLADAITLAAPPECAGCRRPGPAVCEACEVGLRARPRLHRPSPTPEGWIPVHVVADYAGSTRQVITAWKERGRRDVAAHLAEPLARAMAAAIESMPGGTVSIIPIPPSAAARRRRGEDAWGRVVRLAVDLVDGEAGSPRLVVEQCLRHARQTRDQAGLSARERRGNLAGALEAARPMGTPLVVDDIVTTGATLAEAARALRVAGACEPMGAAIAATSRLRG